MVTNPEPSGEGGRGIVRALVAKHHHHGRHCHSTAGHVIRCGVAEVVITMVTVVQGDAHVGVVSSLPTWVMQSTQRVPLKYLHN